MNQKKSLFPEFKPFTAAEWKAQLLKDLKGEPYENLTWNNENGFDIEPFYSEDSQKTKYHPAFTHADWDVCVHASGESKDQNVRLLKNLQRGATSISVAGKNLDYEVALKGIQLDIIRSTFFISPSQIKILHDYLKSNYDLDALNISLFPFEIGNVRDLEEWYKEAKIFGGHSSVSFISADVLSWHNKNCLPYYEIALALSLVTEHLEHLHSQNIKPAGAVIIKTGVNSDYFMQIAKLRAIRRLWLILKKEYKIENTLHVICETSSTNKSISDSYNNLLRTTIEGMAAVAGGCNEMIINDFDVFVEMDKNLSERMAVNQQLILKEESYLDKMADVSCGSFYIEAITDQLATKALETFKSLEKNGGYFKSLEAGDIQKQVDAQSAEQEEIFSKGKRFAIGVNKFRNEKESINVNAEAIEHIRQLQINNPLVNFELQQFFKLKNA